MKTSPKKDRGLWGVAEAAPFLTRDEAHDKILRKLDFLFSPQVAAFVFIAILPGGVVFNVWM